MSGALLPHLVREHFSAHAAEYDRFARVQKRVARQLLDTALAQGWPPGRILDVGCGTGEVGRCLRASGCDRELVISDIAHAMSCRAARELPMALAVDADARALPFRPATFSLVLSASVLQWLEDLAAAFGEVRRVLASGGLCAFALFGAGTLRELRHCHDDALTASGKARGSHFQSFPSVADVFQAVTAGGLNLLRLWSVEETEWHESPVELLRSLKKIGAQNASRERPPGLASRQVMGRMQELYHQRYATPQGVPATYEVIYGLAVRQD